MRLLFDTSVLIAIERERTALDDQLMPDDDAAISAISIAELDVGVQRATGKRRLQRQKFLEIVLDIFEIEPYDLSVARAHADLLFATSRAGKPRGAYDLIIAATAMTRERKLVTADAHAFAQLPGVDALILDT